MADLFERELCSREASELGVGGGEQDEVLFSPSFSRGRTKPIRLRRRMAERQHRSPGSSSVKKRTRPFA